MERNKALITEVHFELFAEKIQGILEEPSNILIRRFSRHLAETLVFIGRGDMIRTCDLLIPNQMRYQAALRPVFDVRPRFYRMFSKTSKEFENIFI